MPGAESREQVPFWRTRKEFLEGKSLGSPHREWSTLAQVSELGNPGEELRQAVRNRQAGEMVRVIFDASAGTTRAG